MEVLGNGKFTLTKIREKFTVIDYNLEWELLEHNTKGEDLVICLNTKLHIYCYTYESLEYTVNHKNSEYEWFRYEL